MKLRTSAIHIIVAAFTLLYCTARSQTYTVGDTVGNFSLEICENGEGTWDYHIDGLHNVTWINLFTSW